MDELARHDQVFHRLLFDPGLRRRLRAGEWEELGETAPIFTEIDLDELERLARAIREGLLAGELGGLGLASAFPRTLATLAGRGETPEEGEDEDDAGEAIAAVVERFMLGAGSSSAPVKLDGTGRQAGVSVLEAFYTWADEALAGDLAARCRAQHEFAAGLLRALAPADRPGFVSAWPLLHRGPRGWCCVLDEGRVLASGEEEPERPRVYLAGPGRYASGSMSAPLAAIVLAEAEAPPAWARRLLATLDRELLAAARAKLTDKGLL